MTAENHPHYTPPEKEKFHYVDWGKALSHPVEKEALSILGGLYGFDRSYRTTFVTDSMNNKTYELLSIRKELYESFSTITHIQEYRVLWSEVILGRSFTDEQKDSLRNMINEYMSSFVFKKE